MPITTVRPDADRNVNSWLTSGASAVNLFATIDDTPTDDSTFIAAQASWPAGYYRARIADLPGGIPAGQRLRAVRIRARVSSHTNATIENVYYALRDPNIGSQAPRDSSFRDKTSWQDGVGVWREANLRGQEWQQPDFAALEVELYSKSYFARVSELWVDADLRALGTLSGITLAGTTTGSRPTVSWTWTPNSDADPQKAYRIRVFTAAQVAAAGFDPDTSASVWSSGWVFGNTSERQLSTSYSSSGTPDLTNGVSYVAYVAVAQDFNGTYWWSPWATQAFTMAFTPPATPTLAATPQYSLPSHRVLLEVTPNLTHQYDRQVVEYCDRTSWHSPPSVNLLVPQLASAGDTAQSTAGFFNRTGTLGGEQARALAGEWALTWSPAATGSAILDVGSPFGQPRDGSYAAALAPGVPHTFSCWARVVSGAGTVRCGLQAIDPTGATVGAAVNGTAVALTTSWTRLAVTATAPAAPTTASDWRPFLERTAGTATILVDQLQLELPAAGCDPSVPTAWQPGGGLGCGWQPVRGALTALAPAADNIARIFDREVPPGGIRLYRAKNELAFPDGTISASPYTSPVAVQGPPAPGLGNWVLKDPFDPRFDALVCVTGISESIDEDQTEYHPIRPVAAVGFGQRPVFASDWISGDNGQLTLTVSGDRAWWGIRQLLGARRSLLLQFPEGGQRFIRLGSRGWPRRRKTTGVSSASGVDWHRVVSLDFKETDRPRVMA